jgi:undecaprenyl-diphosphatase
VALGVHYLSDVLAGWVLGLAWLAATTAAFQAWRRELGGRPVAPASEGLEPEMQETDNTGGQHAAGRSG